MKTHAAWIQGNRSIESLKSDWHQIQLYLGEDALQKEKITTSEGLSLHLSDIDRTCQNICELINYFTDITAIVTETEMNLFYLQAETVANRVSSIRGIFQNHFGEIPSLPIDPIIIKEFIRQPTLQSEFDFLSKETYVLWPTLIRFWQYSQLFGKNKKFRDYLQ